MLYLYLCLPLGIQAKQLVMAAFQGQLRRSLGARLVCQETRTTILPSEAALALTNSLMVMLVATDGR